MSNNFPTGANIVNTLFDKGLDKQDVTLDWNKTAKPLAYELNRWLEGTHGTSPYKRNISYKRFLGLIGGHCIVEQQDADGNPIPDPFTGEPRKHFSSKRLCSMFSKSKLKQGQVELLPKIFKQFNMHGLDHEAYRVR